MTPEQKTEALRLAECLSNIGSYKDMPVDQDVALDDAVSLLRTLAEQPAQEPNMRHPKIQALIGMTLRDYFAAKAMQALIPLASTEVGPAIAEAGGVAPYSYMVADLMLSARSRT